MNKTISLFILLVSNFLNGSTDFTIITFPPEKMIVMENLFGSPHSSNLLTALKGYHETAPFTQTLAQYQQDPEAYFVKRLAALNVLLEEIEKTKEQDPYLVDLKEQVINKKNYIQALPDMRTWCINKPAVNFPQPKLIPLLHKHAIEAIDPLHRGGKEMQVYKNRWLASEIPNFFIYLDSVEHETLLKKYAPQKKQVDYYTTQEERDKHALHFHKGLAYLQGEFFDTTRYQNVRNGKGMALYVLGPDGKFYAHDDQLEENVHHSTEFAGQNIIGGGEVSAVNGKIDVISNRSGHYRPSAESLRETVFHLKQMIGSLDDIKVCYKPNAMSDDLFFLAESFLEKGLHALPLTSQETSLLHFAIQEDLPEWSCLAENPVLLNSLYQGLTPLQFAAKLGKSNWIELLLKHGADVYAMHNDMTALDYAAQSGDLDALHLLYKATKSAKKRKKAVLHAAQSGSIQSLIFFEEKNVPFEYLDENNNNIFHYAAKAPKTNTLIYLLQTNSAKLLDKPNDLQESPLHHAAACGTVQNVRILLSHGLNPIQANKRGNTPIHFAASGGNQTVMDYFLEKIPARYFRSQNKQGVLPLHYATENMPIETYKRLAKKTGKIDPLDDHGQSPLFYAAGSTEDIAQVNLTYLLEYGADASLRNAEGMTVLHKAAGTMKRLVNVMEILSYYDGINDLTDDGNHSLHLALMLQDKSTIKYLLKHATQEQLLHCNNQNLDALSIAHQIGDQEIIDSINKKLQEFQ